MSKEHHWRLHSLRVRYQETDQMGVVFHGNYVTWFEIGRTEWIRAAGYDYRSIEESGLLLPVVDLQCKYIAPAKYDDMVVVCTRIADYSPLRIEFQSQVRVVSEEEAKSCEIAYGDALPGELLVEGGTRHVWVNTQWQPARINRVMPELYTLISGK